MAPRQREHLFQSLVKKHLKLTNTYSPICRDYYSQDQALKIREKLVNKAQKAGLTVLEIKLIMGS